ncbi:MULTISPECIES: RNA polymerase sigma factor [Nocardia]|uniref:RNA polymerase sigma factor n=1 Tax=Nocardia TaxID=1817 RepID=UPI001F428ECA|nr:MULTISPECIES: RNA polymerase sigma factor [Nocardia]
MPNTFPDPAALYLKYRAAMRRKAAQVLHEAGLADQAEDVVQDTFVSLIASPPSGEVRNWEAFLIRCVRNKALDRIRSAAVQHAGPSFDVQLHDGADRSEDLAEDVVEALDNEEAGGRAWDAKAVLNTQQRRVLEEYVAHGRPRGEVARELGVTPARVSQIAKAAAELLKEAINREQVADG